MVRKLLFLGLVCVCLSSSVFEEKSELKEILKDTDGPWNYLGLTGYSGYITMNALTGSSLFYWLFESIGGNITTDNRPIIIWLQGGPGCSGELGMLWENISPITISPASEAFLTNQNYTWATDYHIMTIDFPYGAGYSFANSAGDEKNTTQSATLYLYKFLTILNGKYSTWFNRDLYIFGESYGGHWVPGLAWNILQQNAANPTAFQFKLKGIGMGDPWVDPPTQAVTYASYGLSTSLVNTYEASIVSYYQNLVIENLRSGEYIQAEANWDSAVGSVQTFSGGVNEYNVRIYGEYDDAYVGTWLNKADTKTTLNVPTSQSWVECNNTVYDYYRADLMNSSIVFLPYILSQNVNVLIYNGQDDLIVSSPGVENMMSYINWTGVKDFINAPKKSWFVDGKIAGYIQNYSYLTFVLVLDAGHMSPHDQPVNIKDMVKKYVSQMLWD